MSELKYISGCFCIQADSAFINGAGLEKQTEDRNVVQTKTMWKNGKRIPYVSSQAWKRFLRETLISETKWPESRLRAVGWNPRGNTAKIAGELNPIDYREDDIFGYMFAKGKERDSSKLTPKQLEIVASLPEVQLVRTSTFLASLLYAVQTQGSLNRDEAFVHIPGETPTPYTTEFYNADLQAIFGIDYERLGVFNNEDESELNPKLIDDAIKAGKIVQNPKDKKIYEIKNLNQYRKETVSALLKALAVLRGGAKLAQYGVDISPKVLILAGLTSKNPFLNNLFLPGENGIKLDIEALKELIKDYSDRINTSVHIGIRKGYLANEDEVYALHDSKIESIKILVDTPINAVENFCGEL